MATVPLRPTLRLTHLPTVSQSIVGPGSFHYCGCADGGMSVVVQDFAAFASLSAGFVHFLPRTP